MEKRSKTTGENLPPKANSNDKHVPAKTHDLLRRVFAFKLSGVITALVVITALSCLLSKNFLTAYNITIIVRTLAFIGLVSLGQNVVLLTGEIDLSVGAVAGLAAVSAGILMVQLDLPAAPTLLIALALGCLCGLINGLLVTQLNLNALVVTLGTMGIYSGFNLVVTKGMAITGIPTDIYFLGQGEILGLPAPLIIMLFLMALISFICAKTVFGRHLYAVGSNIEAARLVGLKVDYIKISAFVISGFFSALAGILMVARLGSAQPAIGQIWLLPSVAASVIGGTALTGGEGTPMGAVLGAAIIGVIENIIVLMGISPYWQTVVSGAVVVAAISIDSLQRMIASRRMTAQK